MKAQLFIFDAVLAIALSALALAALGSFQAQDANSLSLQNSAHDLALAVYKDKQIYDALSLSLEKGVIDDSTWNFINERLARYAKILGRDFSFEVAGVRSSLGSRESASKRACFPIVYGLDDRVATGCISVW